MTVRYQHSTETEDTMDSLDAERKAGASGMPKEFIALTHGQEWVAFYESFDKLVQDHLQRSSELLRRAIADREVAQVRAEMEAKLAAERERSRELLAQLREELVASQRQVSLLSESVNNLIAELERLSARLGESLVSYSEHGSLAATAEAPASAQAAEPAPAPAGPAKASSEMPSSASGTDEVLSVAQPFSPEEALASTEAATLENELAGINGLAVSANAEHPTESERSSMVASESDTPASEAAPAATPTPAPGTGYFGTDQSDRPRPHWLSVTRIGTRQ